MSELMAAGLELMLVGMGTVFFFLTTLVFATLLMSALVQKYGPTEAAMPIVAGNQTQKEEEVAAIVSAIQMHRNRGK